MNVRRIMINIKEISFRIQVAQLQELRHHVNDLLTLNHGFYNEAENARDGDDMLKYRKFIGQCEMGIQIIDLLLGYIAGNGR